MDEMISVRRILQTRLQRRWTRPEEIDIVEPVPDCEAMPCNRLKGSSLPLHTLQVQSELDGEDGGSEQSTAKAEPGQPQSLLLACIHGAAIHWDGKNCPCSLAGALTHAGTTPAPQPPIGHEED